MIRTLVCRVAVGIGDDDRDLLGIEAVGGIVFDLPGNCLGLGLVAARPPEADRGTFGGGTPGNGRGAVGAGDERAGGVDRVGTEPPGVLQLDRLQ